MSFEKVKCTLCPRQCSVDRSIGQKGFCGADDKLKIARAALHYWEEPCISGENGSGTVFFSGCNMKCVYCQNYSISTCNNGFVVTVNELSEHFIRLQNEGANNINLVTPTHFAEEIIKALDIAREKGLNIPVVYNSSGYESIDTIKRLDGYVDIYMPDMKYFSDKYAVKYSNAPNYFNYAKSALDEMFKQAGKPVFDENGIMQKGVIVRHLMLPGLLFDSKKIMDYLYSVYKNDIYISIMNQYTPLPHVSAFPELNRRIDEKYYQTLVNYCMDIGIENAFVQEGEAADESFIPQFYTDK